MLSFCTLWDSPHGHGCQCHNTNVRAIDVGVGVGWVGGWGWRSPQGSQNPVSSRKWWTGFSSSLMWLHLSSRGFPGSVSSLSTCDYNSPGYSLTPGTVQLDVTGHYILTATPWSFDPGVRPTQ